MSKRPPTSGTRLLRRGVKSLAWGVVLLGVIFGGSNLLLSSRWMAGMVEAKLKSRSGLDCHLDGMSWSPWNGLTVRKFQIFQPEELRQYLTAPVLEVSEVRVEPYWSALFHGRMEVRTITVDSPKATIPLELLAHLTMDRVHGNPLPSLVQTKAPGSGRRGATPSKAEGNVLPTTGTQPGPSKKRVTDIQEDHVVVATPAKEPEKKLAPERPPAGMPLQLIIKNATLDVVSIKKEGGGLHMEGIDLSLPLFGEDADGELRIASISFPSFPAISKVLGIKESITWSRPFLKWENPHLDISGVTTNCRVQVGFRSEIRSRQELPFLVEVVMPPQEVKSGHFLDQLGVKVEATQWESRFRCVGLLQQPATWRAEMQSVAKMVRVRERHGGHDIVFDDLVVPAIFRQGRLIWGGVRMVGEDVSILGNGQVSLRDGALAVTRFVVSPEVAEMVSRALHGAGVPFRGAWWEDLDTPDRKVRDLLVTGPVAEMVVDVGYHHEEMSVWEMVATTVGFIRDELKEEEEKLKSVDHHENH